MAGSAIADPTFTSLSNIISNDEKNTLLHILEVRDRVLTVYEEKCSPLLHKLASSIIPELCPHYARYYKEILNDCEKQMYP